MKEESTAKAELALELHKTQGEQQEASGHLEHRHGEQAWPH